MKIGIITFHRVVNYGAQLQAFALQNYIESIGYDCSIVDYWPNYRQETLKVFSLKNLLAMPLKRKLVYIKDTLLTFVRKSKRLENTKLFASTYLPMSSEKKFDVLVCGSDQIWRKIHYPLFNGYDKTYFGGGDEVKAVRIISYAASMGAVKFDTKSDENQFGALISNFDAVSVREIDLKNLLDQRFHIQSELVCDPVFLIGKEEWDRLIDRSLIPEIPYVFYYNHQKLKITTHFANKLASKKRLPIIEMRGEVTPLHYSSRYRMTANAQEFLSLLYGAEYVVTSSFHGVALSVCLQKQFFFSSSTIKSNRITSLLSLLNLMSREIKSVDMAFSEIDYSEVAPLLDDYVSRSRKWLKDNL